MMGPRMVLVIVVATFLLGTTAANNLFDYPSLNSDGKTSGVISSEQWPNLYPPNVRSKHIFKLGDGLRVKLIFTAFDLMESDSCKEEFVKILNYTDNNYLNDNVIGAWCGKDKPPTASYGGAYVNVFFQSDTVEDKTHQGFSAVWTIENVNECNTTDNGGCPQDCVDTHGSYRCVCRPGYYSSSPTGTDCLDTDECASQVGLCEQQCVNTVGSYSCSCYTGFSYNGTHCNDVDECAQDNGGCDQTCTNTPGGRDCSCDAGFVSNGTKCQVKDECQQDNGGCDQLCTNTHGSLSCSCREGYQRNSSKCNDMDECLHDNGGCEQTCLNTHGSYQCDCTTGFVSNAKQCEDINECQESNGGCDQICTNTMASFLCNCSHGFSLQNDDTSCQDVDECAESNGGCDHVCTNTEGSYHCSCSEGYSKNGTQCNDVDECYDSNGGCAQMCSNTDGSYDCWCDMGFTKCGAECFDVDECTESNGGCDHLCTNTEGSYNCSCREGYSKNGTQCNDVDECADKSGGCAHTCINTHGSFRCSCLAGFFQNDSSCYDPCTQVNCGQDRLCQLQGDTIACICLVEEDCQENSPKSPGSANTVSSDVLAGISVIEGGLCVVLLVSVVLLSIRQWQLRTSKSGKECQDREKMYVSIKIPRPNLLSRQKRDTSSSEKSGNGAQFENVIYACADEL